MVAMTNTNSYTAKLAVTYPAVCNTSIYNDLRPISLLPTTAKVFESIVGKWFLSHIEPCLDNCRKSTSLMLSLPSFTLGWHAFTKCLLTLKKHLIILLLVNCVNIIYKFSPAMFASYLSNHQHHVHVNSSLSSFRLLNGAMPQGSWLGPLAFLLLIDDLPTGCPVHTYVYNTNLSELVQSEQLVIHISTYLVELLTWAAQNGMQFNISKTKEMILDQLAVTNQPLLSISPQTIKRVTCFKPLGVYIDSSVSWSTHIDHVILELIRRWDSERTC